MHSRHTHHPLFIIKHIVPDVPGIVCEDFYAKCSKWATDGECKSNRDWMNNNCRKSCNVCHLFTEDSLKQRCTLDGVNAKEP